MVFVATGGRGRFWADLLGVWLAGEVAAPVSGDASRLQRTQLVDLARPEIVLQDASAWPTAMERPQGEDGDLQGVGAILFTSGSSGVPKGVKLTQRALLGNALATVRRLELRAGDRLSTAIPCHFTSAICHFLAATLAGATHVSVSRRLLPADFFRFLSNSAPDAFGGASLQLRWMGAAPEQVPRTLRWAMSSGDRLPPRVIHDLTDAVPHLGIVAAYGLTEVAGRLCILDPSLAKVHAGSVGSPIEGLRVIVRRENGEPCNAEEPGDVCVAGEWLFSGYLRDAAGTAAAVRGGEFLTGDIGALDVDGRLRLLGRRDDVFKVGGQKVSASVVAESIFGLGYFADVVVLPVERQQYGEVPEAWIVWKADATPLPHGELLRLLREVLPPNHIPLAIHRLEFIPRLGSGKVDRGALRRASGETL